MFHAGNPVAQLLGGTYLGSHWPGGLLLGGKRHQHFVNAGQLAHGLFHHDTQGFHGFHLLGLGIEGKHHFTVRNGNFGDQAGAYDISPAIGGGNALQCRQYNFLSNISHYSPCSQGPRIAPKGNPLQVKLTIA